MKNAKRCDPCRGRLRRSMHRPGASLTLSPRLHAVSPPGSPIADASSRLGPGVDTCIITQPSETGAINRQPAAVVHADVKELNDAPWVQRAYRRYRASGVT
jgi:hypothetical protein